MVFAKCPKRTAMQLEVQGSEGKLSQPGIPLLSERAR